MSEVKVETRLAKIVHIIDPGYAPGPSEVVINHGSLNGVKVGDRFLVFGTGPHIADPDTKQDLGALELVRGRGVVVHVQDNLPTIRTTERRRARPARRITREAGRNWSNTVALAAMIAGGNVIEEELSPEEELPFEAVQLGDLAKPI